MSATSKPAPPTQKSCPGLSGKGCGKFLASWDDHPLCTSCRRTALEPCLGIFACPTCVDWSEEQRLRFNNRRTYRKKVPSSAPSDLGDLLVIDCATDPAPTEPVTPPPPSQPMDSTPTVPAQHILESLLMGLSTQLSFLTASLRTVPLRAATVYYCRAHVCTEDPTRSLGVRFLRFMGGLRRTSTRLPPPVQYSPMQERHLPVRHLAAPAGPPQEAAQGAYFGRLPTLQ